MDNNNSLEINSEMSEINIKEELYIFRNKRRIKQ